MATYGYGRIKKLAESLENEGINQDIIAQIMEGGDTILAGTSPEKKADWLREAMRRMDQLLNVQTRHSVREACACCLGGKRLKLSKEIAKKYETLEDRVRAANETRFVFGHSVTMQADGKILVCFGPDDEEAHYRCPCLPKADEPLPVTYCYCCGGHVKHHLQIALGLSLELKVRSSVLSSGGKRPCTFLFTIKDSEARNN
jgi:hypothetical protein